MRQWPGNRPLLQLAMGYTQVFLSIWIITNPPVMKPARQIPMPSVERCLEELKTYTPKPREIAVCEVLTHY